jgi:hypothetical protein
VPQKAWAEECPVLCCIITGVDDVNILEALLLWDSGSSMLHVISICYLYQALNCLDEAYLVKLAKVPSQIPLGIDIKVLLRTEKDNSSVGDQPG